MTKTFHSWTVRKKILINAARDKVWKKISNVAKLAKQFKEFVLHLEAFYEKTLRNIKLQIEN